MATRKRLKREAAERSGPIRNKALGSSPEPARNSGARYTVGTAIDEGINSACRVVEVADATVRGAVERGVNTAYTVIEEYMLRGRQSAGQYHARNHGSDDMNGERQNGGGWPPLGGMGAMNPMEPWLAMMRLWGNTMSAFVPGGAALGGDWMNQFMPGMCPPGFPPASRMKVSVQLSSKSPAEVTVDLPPCPEHLKLTAEPLVHAGGASAPPLIHTRIDHQLGHVRVSLTIPTDQPAGRYHGAINDSLGVRRGELVVEIEAAPVTRSRTRKPQ